MQSPIDRVMQAYGMMVNLTPEQEAAARARLEGHLADIDADDSALAIEGLKFLRGSDRPVRRKSK
jgi:hypothetical protein